MVKKLSVKLREIQLLVYDFDGVMTDNRVYVFSQGQEAVACNRNDGLAVSILKNKGIRQIIISTETNKIVKTRAKKLGIPVICAVKDKKQCLLDYCRRNKINLAKVIYVGNEINDLEVMQSVGYCVCPQDACAKIKHIADRILTKKGGQGVIRELVEILFNA